MFNVFAFLLRPPTWLYVLLTKLLFFFFLPHPTFFPPPPLSLSLSISSSPNVHASTFAQSIRRSLVSLLLSITPPPTPLTPFLQLARAILHPGCLRILFTPRRPLRYIVYNRARSRWLTRGKKQVNLTKRPLKRSKREIEGGGSAKLFMEDGFLFFFLSFRKCELSRKEICLFTGLISGGRILLEPRSRRNEGGR